MTFKTDTRVRETSVTTGAGDYTLAGAPTGFNPFSVLGANNYCPYWASDGVNFEEGIGLVLAGPARLSRTHVMKSSNGGAAVNWGAGSKDIVCGPIASLALPRVVTKSVAGAVDVTLTQLEQRCNILILTGALTANINVIVDATGWKWSVFNSTSGAFSLTVKTAAGTGIAVTQGTRASLYCDEINVARSNNDGLFASGTRMLFQQTSAPTGWTKEASATYNDAALRLVTGTAATGGADAFTTHFGTGKATAAYTLAVADIPAHAHTWGANNCAAPGGAGTPGLGSTADNTSSIGGGGEHTHTLNNFNLKYADCIIATKA